MKPRYIIDLDVLERTAKIARANADKLGVRLLMSLKSFPLPAAFPVIAPYIEGFTASGLYEAKLGSLSRRNVHVHAPAYTPDEIDEICATCSHVVFNSLPQLQMYGAKVAAKGRSVGIRLNPGFSKADCLAYDPCCPDSRFGVLPDELRDQDLHLVKGIHVHALCEGYADDFAEMVEKLTDILKSSPLNLARLKWINLGGGEVINAPAFASPRAIDAVARLKRLGPFEVYIEPSEYMVRYAGSIEAHVLDVMHRDKDIAILDISGSCHASDLLLFKMTPDVWSPALAAQGTPHPVPRTILTCVSCLAGDVLGEYTFAAPLKPGDTVVLGGLGSYSFAQQSWFNGIAHLDVVLRSAAQGDRTVLSWNFQDYLREFWQSDSRKYTPESASAAA